MRDYAITVADEPQVCGTCGVRHWWFITRDGCTRCWKCDFDYLKSRDQSRAESRDVPAEVRS